MATMYQTLTSSGDSTTEKYDSVGELAYHPGPAKELTRKLSCLSSVKRGESGERPAIPAPTFVIWIADSSGSMEGLWTPLVHGYDKFIKEQQKECQPDTSTGVRLTTIVFDETITIIGEVGTPIHEVTENPLEKHGPCKCTALNDAIGYGIEILQKLEDMNKIKYPTAKYQLITFTDGYDNSSKKWSSSKLRTEIKEHEKRGWVFTYLGANQDAGEMGEILGFNRDFCGTVDSTPEAMGQMCRLTSRQVSNCSAGIQRGFTQEERDQLSAPVIVDLTEDDSEEETMLMPPSLMMMERQYIQRKMGQRFGPPIAISRQYAGRYGGGCGGGGGGRRRNRSVNSDSE